LLVSWCGFLLGHLAGVFLEVKVMKIGTLQFLPASFGAGMALFFAQALTAQSKNRKSSR